MTDSQKCKACGHTIVADALLLTGLCNQERSVRLTCRPKTLEEVVDFITAGCTKCGGGRFLYVKAEIKQMRTEP